MECYGNLLIREKTFNWILERSSDLIRVVTDGKGPLAELIDFSQLKFRERDDIEFVFKYWRDTSRKFDGPLLWDIRLRQYLANRYDNRDNAFDWDYHMKLKDSVSYFDNRILNALLFTSPSIVDGEHEALGLKSENPCMIAPIELWLLSI